MATVDVKDLDVTAARNSHLAAQSGTDVSPSADPSGPATLVTLATPSSTDKAQPIVEEPKGVVQKSGETSSKKKKANRRNALKSTGPKTTVGKLSVRFNAMKHGCLSKQMVISTKFIQENPQEFQALVAECWEYFQPIGRPEELLVEQIAVCFWSSRRALRCELGEVKKSMDLDSEELQAKLDDRSSLNIALDIGTLSNAKSELENEGVLSERTVYQIRRYFDKYRISSRDYLDRGSSDFETWKKRLLKCIEGDDPALGRRT